MERLIGCWSSTRLPPQLDNVIRSAVNGAGHPRHMQKKKAASPATIDAVMTLPTSTETERTSGSLDASRWNVLFARF